MLNTDEKSLRNYLLGDTSEEEQEALELWLMSDDAAYDLLVAAEDDLVDDSIAGKLNRHELERFDSHFLAAPERKRKLWFAQRLRKFVDQTNAGVEGSKSQTQAISLWDLFRIRPVLGYAAAALIVLIAVGGFWSRATVLDLQRQLATERETFKQQLSETQLLEAKLQAEFQALEQAVKNVQSSPAPEALLAFNLGPGLSRSPADIQKVPLSPASHLIQLSLLLLDDNYESYRAVLVDDSDKEFWTRDRLASTATPNGKAIVLIVPTERLTPGEYRIRLSGFSKSDPAESVGTYYFQGVRP